jgi:hypothetical protein
LSVAFSLLTIHQGSGSSHHQPAHPDGLAQALSPYRKDKPFWQLPGSKKEMGMIGKQYPPITGGLGFSKQRSQAIKKLLPILLVPKYLSTLYPPYHNVMKNTGSVESG